MLDFSFLLDPTGVEEGVRYLDWVIQGLKWTLLVSIVAWCIAVCIGIWVGVGRTLPPKPIFKLVRGLCTAYVECFRNIPLLLQLFLWFYVLPEVLPVAWGNWLKQDLRHVVPWTSFFAEYVFATWGLGLYTAARVAEQIRAGIESVSAGQGQAAQSLGMSLLQRYRFVLLPQSIRLVWPVLTSECLSLFKNSSLALTIGLLELTAQTRQIADYTFRTFEIFLVSTCVYVLISLSVTWGMRAIERAIQPKWSRS
jgi:glutamate/aspartate transport system permease protein